MVSSAFLARARCTKLFSRLIPATQKASGWAQERGISERFANTHRPINSAAVAAARIDTMGETLDRRMPA